MDRALRSSSYEVVVGYPWKKGTEQHKLTPKSESEFLDWQLSEAIVLSVRNIGSVSEIKRKNGKPVVEH